MAASPVEAAGALAAEAAAASNAHSGGDKPHLSLVGRLSRPTSSSACRKSGDFVTKIRTARVDAIIEQL